jgi:hypothetical protein
LRFYHLDIQLNGPTLEIAVTIGNENGFVSRIAAKVHDQINVLCKDISHKEFKRGTTTVDI